VPAPTSRVETKSIELRAGVRRHTRNWNKALSAAASAVAVLVVAFLIYTQLRS
jgi:hypothetical protein